MAVVFCAQLIVVLAIDLLVGDPRWRFHPIRLIGQLGEGCEQLARRADRWLSLRVCGVLAFLTVLGVTVLAASLGLYLLAGLHPLVAVGGALLLLYFSVAAGDLLKHARLVLSCLQKDDIDRARQAVAMLVGRDTQGMKEADIARACIESVAENLVDGVTAPLFWGVAGGLTAPLLGIESILGAALGTLVYKVVNTMDSMYGYRNERYLEFGWFAARTDDWANFLPARMSGICVIGAAFILGYDGRGAARAYVNDRLQSSSPNSGHTEAAAAGALGVQLGGAASYFGVLQQKPFINAGRRAPTGEDIERCNRLVPVATALFTALILLVYLLVMALI